MLHAVSTGALFMRWRRGGRGGWEGRMADTGVFSPPFRSFSFLTKTLKVLKTVTEVISLPVLYQNIPYQLYCVKPLYTVSFISSESNLFMWLLMKMSWRNLRLWHEFVPPAFMCLGAIIDFCVVPRRACPTSLNPHTHARTHTDTHSKACCSINETWIRHEERPPSYTLTQGLPLPSCFLSADYPAFTGLWLSGARKRFSPLSRSRHTHALTSAHIQACTHMLPTVGKHWKVSVLLCGWLLTELQVFVICLKYDRFSVCSSMARIY